MNKYCYYIDLIVDQISYKTSFTGFGLVLYDPKNKTKNDSSDKLFAFLAEEKSNNIFKKNRQESMLPHYFSDIGYIV